MEEKVVIRMNSGELIKGYMSENDLDAFANSGCGKCRLRDESNTTAVYISPAQVKGLFTVVDFDGNVPGPMGQLFFRIRSIVSGNIPLIVSTSVVALLTLAGVLLIL